MKRILALMLALLLTASVLASCDEAALNGAVEVEKENSKNETESKDTSTSDGTPMLRINEKNNKWEISTDGGKTWKNTGVSATGENGTNGTNGANGSDGKDGANGANGTDGKDGKDGNGILKIEVIDNNVWITYTSNPNTPVNVGRVSPEQYDIDFYRLADGTYGIKAGKVFYIENLIIPSTYRDKEVTRILADGFENCQIKTVTIPSTIKVLERLCGCVASTVYYDGDIRSWLSIDIQSEGFQDMYYDTTTPLTFTEDFYMRNSSGEYQLVTDVVIPNGIEAIPRCTFYAYDGLKTITLPEGVKTIEDSAFSDSGLVTINLPKSLEGIKKYAFNYCFNLENVYYNGTIEEWYNITFESNPYAEYCPNSNPMHYAKNLYVKNSSGGYDHYIKDGSGNLQLTANP
jgi:hypothetical protein